MPTKSSMTQAEFNVWLRSYQATRQCLSDSILSLQQSLFNIPPNQQDSVNFQISLQNDKVNRLDTERTLFYAGSIRMEPPSATVVQQLEAFATKADVLIAQATASVQAVQLADQAVSLYHSAVSPAAA
jgi:hypothetical protein